MTTALASAALARGAEPTDEDVIRQVTQGHTARFERLTRGGCR